MLEHCIIDVILVEIDKISVALYKFNTEQIKT